MGPYIGSLSAKHIAEADLRLLRLYKGVELNGGASSSALEHLAVFALHFPAGANVCAKPT